MENLAKTEKTLGFTHFPGKFEIMNQENIK